MTMNRLTTSALPTLLLLVAGPTRAIEGEPGTRPPQILSAFFGLDDALPAAVEALCPGGTGLDGLPVVFSEEIDPATLDPFDFRVYVGSGQGRRPRCATLRPASEEDENRTVLLIGDLADAVDDPPVGVEVSGELRTEDGTNLRGVRTDVVTPLEDGPFLVFAEVLVEGEGQIGAAGRGGGCPEGTAQVVRVYWAGGVRAPDGSEPGDAERVHVRIVADDAAEALLPFALGDLNDNDNVIDLCLDRTVRPRRVEVDAGIVVDPHGDRNPPTVIDLD